MRILLIKPNYNDATDVTPPLGTGYLAAVARQGGHEVRLLDNRIRSQSHSHYIATLKSWRPDIVGFSAVTYEKELVKKLVCEARDLLPEVKTVIGGPIAWADPADALLEGMIDYAVQGEGETAFRKLLAKIDDGQRGDDLPSVATWNESGEVRINPPEEFIQKVDELPFPAWDLFDMPSYHRSPRMGYVFKYKEYFPIFSSRGCPYGCIYCHKIFGRRYRARSPENVLREIETLVQQYRIREIQIVDDTFNVDMERAKRIFEGIIERNMKIGICFPSGLRGDLLNEEFIDLMARAGTFRVSVAVETASPKIQRLIKKNVDLEKLREVIRLMVKKRIITNIYNMVGFPEETLSDALLTTRYAYRSKAHSATFFFVHPLPGTELAAMIRRSQLEIDDSTIKQNFFDPHVAKNRISKMSPKELRRVVRNAAIWFYVGHPSRLWRIVRDLPQKKQMITLPIIILTRHIAPGLLHLFNRLRRNERRIQH